MPTVRNIIIRGDVTSRRKFSGQGPDNAGHLHVSRYRFTAGLLHDHHVPTRHIDYGLVRITACYDVQ